MRRVQIDRRQAARANVRPMRGALLTVGVGWLWLGALALAALSTPARAQSDDDELLLEGDYEDIELEGEFEDEPAPEAEAAPEADATPEDEAPAADPPAPTADPQDGDLQAGEAPEPAPSPDGASAEAPVEGAPTDATAPAPADPASVPEADPGGYGGATIEVPEELQEQKEKLEADVAAATEAEATDDAPPAEAPQGVAAELTAAAASLFRVGDPIPLTQREPTVRQFELEVDVHYGLVGTGPTRLTNDIRFGLTDWWELRTTLMPYPGALNSRIRLGSQRGLLGAFMFDVGMASFDAGIRLVEDEGEAALGPRFHFNIGLAYTRAIGKSFSVYGAARFRYRYSPVLDNDDQNAIAVDGMVTYDLLDNLAISGGFGYAEVIGTPVRELSVNFVEIDRPGMSHFLLRDDGWSRSVTVPLAMTYGRVDSFDVDVFVTPRVWPQFDVLFGAGIRWRFDPIGPSGRKAVRDTLNDVSPILKTVVYPAWSSRENEPKPAPTVDDAAGDAPADAPAAEADAAS